MAKNTYVTLPSDFIDIIDYLGDSVSIAEIEEKIIKHALTFTGAKWGSIKYYYGSQFVSGFSSVPLKYRLTPRKRGFMYKTFSHNVPHLMTEKVLREAHPESHTRLKSILIIPLRMDRYTLATISLLDTRNRSLRSYNMELLNDFSTVYGRVLNMAHRFVAEKKAVDTRDKMMSFTAHEIKNPLMALSSYLQIIQTSIDKRAPIKKEWLQKMRDEVVRIKSLSNEFLSIRHSDRADLTYNFSTLSVRNLIEQVCENFRVRHPQRKIVVSYSIDSSDDITIMGDEGKLVQVLINLLNNAHKFSDTNDDVDMTVTSTSSTMKIKVKDRGIGIPADELPFVFKEYYRGSNGEHKKGIGVGLFLVRSIIESHKGKVTVKSVLGKGTTFSIMIPRTSSP